jgi:protein phosphatase
MTPHTGACSQSNPTHHIIYIQYALELLAHSRKLFATEPTLQDIVIPEGHRLTLVGDLHGQLQDLFTIFTLNGLPSEVRACVDMDGWIDR